MLTLSSYGPSQADVASYKALKATPEAAKYPHAYRWYRHMSSYESEFSSLPGDPSKAYTTYGMRIVVMHLLDTVPSFPFLSSTQAGS